MYRYTHIYIYMYLNLFTRFTIPSESTGKQSFELLWVREYLRGLTIVGPATVSTMALHTAIWLDVESGHHLPIEVLV